MRLFTLLLFLTAGMLQNASAQRFSWVKQFSGVKGEVVRTLDVNAQGHVYTSGYFQERTDFDPGPGTYNLNGRNSPSTSFFITKHDVNGNLYWAYSMDAFMSAEELKITPAGDILIAGYLQEYTVDFDFGPAVVELSTAGSRDGLLWKMDQSAKLKWAKRFGGTGFETINSMATDASGNIYVAGYFDAVADFDPDAGTFNLTPAGGNDIFISKFDSLGNFIWAKRIGGTEDDEANSISVDPSGNVLVTGSFRATVDFDPGAATLNLTTAGEEDIFVMKLNPAGNLMWAKKMGGPTLDESRAMVIDDAGGAYVTGVTTGVADFDPGAGISNINSGSYNNTFVVKLNGSGNFEWVKAITGSNGQEAKSIALSSSGTVYSTGFLRRGPNYDLDPGPATQLYPTVDLTMYLWQLDTAGNYINTKCVASPEGIEARDMLIDAADNIFLAGVFEDTVDFDPGAGQFTLNAAGLGDAFILKLNGQLPSMISGNVWEDQNANCIRDTSETGVPRILVKAEPGPYYGLSDDSGNYKIYVFDTGLYTVSAITPNPYWATTCTTPQTVPITTPQDTVAGVDLALKALVRCPQLSVELATTRLRPCVISTYYIGYNNAGTLPASNAYVQVDFGIELVPQSSTIPWSAAGGGVYTFPLGNVGVNEQGSFGVQVLVGCSGRLRTTQCVTAHIYPDSICAPPPAGWDKSETVVKGSCINDSLVCFTIKNRSAAGGGDMGGAASWRLYANDTLVMQGTYQLAGQDSMIKCFPANGKTYRLEADQNQPHPGNSRPRAFVEACGNPFSTGFVNTAPQDDEGPFVETFCMEVTGSYDPNDKRVTPAGITSNHYITKDDELEYMIRFQNTGNDTAFKVVITDTIDTDVLDITTLTNGASSHSGTFTIYGHGIAEWTFNNILLPDSFVDEPGSHGFVQFKIKQLPNNPDGTRIENRAAIYFDFNAPVITNYAWSEVNEAALPQALLETEMQVITNAKCKNNADGIAEVTVTGGLAPYHYLWSNGDTTALAINLTAGTHTVTITDAANTVLIDSVIITEPPLLDITITRTNLTCFGDNSGSATVTVMGGVPPYTPTWDSGQHTFSIFDLPAGLYAVVVYDSNNCNTVDSVTITQPALLTANLATADASCFGAGDGAANVTAAGGTAPYTFEWSTGSVNDSISNVPAGVYAVTVTDTNGCMALKSDTIAEPDAIVFSVAVTDVTCFGDSSGALLISGSALHHYLWSTGDTAARISGLAAGVYVVTITDSSGCQQTDSSLVAQPALLVNNVTGTNLPCSGGGGGTALATVSGGTAPYSVAWNHGETTFAIDSLPAGVYVATVRDSNGCEAIDSITITPSVPMTTSISVTHATCFGANDGTAKVVVANGTLPYSFVWSAGAPLTTDSVSGLAAGAYVLTVTDVLGCSVTDAFTVNEPAEITYTAQVVDIICIGDSNGAIFISGNAGYQYLWSTGDILPAIGGLKGGIYGLTITNVDGCTRADSITVVEPDSVKAIITAYTDVTCFGDSNGTATVAASGGIGHYNYEWSNGSRITVQTNLNAGTHTVTVEDGNGCTATTNVTITQPPQFVFNLTVVQSVSCFGGQDGEVEVSITGGVAPYGFQWSPAVVVPPAPVPAGTYSATVTDANGCTQEDSVTIEDGALVIAGNIAGADTADIAITETYSVNAGYSYAWSVTNGFILSGQGTNTVVVDWTTTPQGTIQVIASEAGCADTILKSVVLVDPTGIEEISLNQFELYPNPTSENVTLKLKGALQQPSDVTLLLYDAVGREILQQEVKAQELQQGVQIDLGAFDAGVFFVSMKTNDEVRVVKVVKY